MIVFIKIYFACVYIYVVYVYMCVHLHIGMYVGTRECSEHACVCAGENQKPMLGTFLIFFPVNVLQTSPVFTSKALRLRRGPPCPPGVETAALNFSHPVRTLFPKLSSQQLTMSSYEAFQIMQTQSLVAQGGFLLLPTHLAYPFTDFSWAPLTPQW